MSRSTRPLQFKDAQGFIIPFNPSDAKTIVAYVSDLYRYYGMARPGTAVTTAAWRISRETVNTSGNTVAIDWVNGNNDFINVWNSGTTLAITGASQANPCVISVASTATLTTGDIVYIASVAGMVQLNGNHYKITKLNATTFSLQDPDNDANINSTAFTAWSSGGTVNKVEYANYSFS